MSNVLSFHLYFAFFLSLSLSLSKPNRENGGKKIDMFEVYFFFLGVMKTRTPHICQLLISLQIHHQQLFSIPYKSPISALLMHCRWIIDVSFVHVLYSRHCIYLNNRACLHIVVWRTSTRSVFLFEFSSSCDENTFFEKKKNLKINDGNATTHVLLNDYKKS